MFYDGVLPEKKQRMDRIKEWCGVARILAEVSKHGEGSIPCRRVLASPACWELARWLARQTTKLNGSLL